LRPDISCDGGQQQRFEKEDATSTKER
jgi:hypothetical protein